jgi:two-component sensor histidine kinase
MITTAVGLGVLLAYLFASFMARPLRAAIAAATAVGEGKEVEPLSSPLIEANTITTALSAASQELTRRQEHSAFLMRELAHRLKNQLGIVQGMVLQTGRQASSVEQFMHQLSRRIEGLAESQELMLQENWKGAWLGDLVSAHLNLFGVASRAQISGPPLFLSAHAVQNIGFALHELATNGFKHGSLAVGNGRVMVSWGNFNSEGRIRLEWIELDGPPVQSPAHHGFGFLVITKLVAQALQGTANAAFLPNGLRWSLEFPASHVLTIHEDQELR